MNARKTWLQNLGSHWQDAWTAEGRRASFDGAIRIETRRSSYLFVDGICTAVTRRDGGEEEASPMLGMNLVGFVRDGEELSEGWLPGARAVLHRGDGMVSGELAVALTSPTFACMRLASRGRSHLHAANDDSDRTGPSSERRVSSRPSAPSYADVDPASLQRVRVSA